MALGGAHSPKRAASTTRFRLSGGEGAFSAAPRPAAVADGAATAPAAPAAGAGGGRILAERSFDPASPTDDGWLTLVPLLAADGEQIGGAVWGGDDNADGGGDWEANPYYEDPVLWMQ